MLRATETQRERNGNLLKKTAEACQPHKAQTLVCVQNKVTFAHVLVSTGRYFDHRYSYHIIMCFKLRFTKNSFTKIMNIHLLLYDATLRFFLSTPQICKKNGKPAALHIVKLR